MDTFKFKVEIKALIEFDEEVEMYVAKVPALKIYSQAKTKAKAELAIVDAIESYLKVAHKHNLPFTKDEACNGGG